MNECDCEGCIGSFLQCSDVLVLSLTKFLFIIIVTHLIHYQTIMSQLCAKLSTMMLTNNSYFVSYSPINVLSTFLFLKIYFF